MTEAARLATELTRRPAERTKTIIVVWGWRHGGTGKLSR
jgi:hypothetical protein